MREKNRERGGGRMRRLSRFPSNFSNLIKSCSVRKLNFVSTEYPVTTPYPLVRPSFVNAVKIRDEESDTVSYVLIYVGGWFDWLVGIAFRSSKVQFRDKLVIFVYWISKALNIIYQTCNILFV